MGLALCRAGYEVWGKGLIGACARSFSDNSEESEMQEDSSAMEVVEQSDDMLQVACTDPYQQVTTQKKRGRPPSSGKVQQQMIVASSYDSQLQKKLQRLAEQVEVCVAKQEKLAEQVTGIDRSHRKPKITRHDYSQETIDYAMDD
eukprot:1780744-Amphidinium_carterae.1